MTNRPTWDEHYLSMAHLLAQRGTCARRQVGAVLVNRHYQVLATGYNGPASGQPHCIVHPCAGASAPSGQGLELCEAIHAEQNALLQCANIKDIAICYTTTAPCAHCLKLLLNTPCQHLVFHESYPHWEQTSHWWTRAHRTWAQPPK